MKTIITAALILAANNVTAGGFSPWPDTTTETAPIAHEVTVTQEVGFGPWRERNVADEVQIRTISDPIFSNHTAHVFSPWS